MIELDLLRINDGVHGCFGVLISSLAPFAVTLEPPWINNEKNISCIPSDSYICSRVDSPRYGDVFHVDDVPNRTHVLLHWGNLVKNTEGCILIAEKFGMLNGEPGVLTSRTSPGEGFNELMQMLKGEDSFRLNIIWKV